MVKKRKFFYSLVFFLLIGVVFSWSFLLSQPGNSCLEVNFFDVGQGDSVFIKTAEGWQILIDGGPDKTILEKLNQEMAFYDRAIDLVVLTHPDSDHLTGLISVLENYQIGHIITGGFEKKTAAYEKWRALISEKKIPFTLAQAGQKIIFQDNLYLEILWPDQKKIGSLARKANNASVVGRLIYGQTEFLLTGDIERKIENYLVKENHSLASDVLKVPHHGSKTSSGISFIQAADPSLVIISAGKDNRYGHPDEEVLKRYQGRIILRTDRLGDIEILSNGREIAPNF